MCCLYRASSSQEGSDGQAASKRSKVTGQFIEDEAACSDTNDIEWEDVSEDEADITVADSECVSIPNNSWTSHQQVRNAEIRNAASNHVSYGTTHTLKQLFEDKNKCFLFDNFSSFVEKLRTQGFQTKSHSLVHPQLNVKQKHRAEKETKKRYVEEVQRECPYINSRKGVWGIDQEPFPALFEGPDSLDEATDLCIIWYLNKEAKNEPMCLCKRNHKAQDNRRLIMAIKDHVMQCKQRWYIWKHYQPASITCCTQLIGYTALYDMVYPKGQFSGFGWSPKMRGVLNRFLGKLHQGSIRKREFIALFKPECFCYETTEPKVCECPRGPTLNIRGVKGGQGEYRNSEVEVYVNKVVYM